MSQTFCYASDMQYALLSSQQPVGQGLLLPRCGEAEVEAQRESDHTASVWWELSSALTHLRTAYVACSFFLAGMQILRFHKENQEIFFLSFSCFEIETCMSANAS